MGDNYPANLRLYKVDKELRQLKDLLRSAIQARRPERYLLQLARHIKHTEIRVLIIKKNRLKYDYRSNGGIRPLPEDFAAQLAAIDGSRADWESLSDGDVLESFRTEGT